MSHWQKKGFSWNGLFVNYYCVQHVQLIQLRVEFKSFLCNSYLSPTHSAVSQWPIHDRYIACLTNTWLAFSFGKHLDTDWTARLVCHRGIPNFWIIQISQWSYWPRARIFSIPITPYIRKFSPLIIFFVIIKYYKNMKPCSYLIKAGT